MAREHRGSSAQEAEDYLVSAFRTCTGFELAVVTTAEAGSRRELRQSLRAAGARVEVVEPSADFVGRALRPEVIAKHRGRVCWIESDDESDLEAWRELAVALNRSRERLRDQHRYLWVLAGSLSLRQLMARHAQDIYSGAYKVPHVTARVGAAFTWLHLSDLQLGAAPRDSTRQAGDVWRSIDALLLPDLARSLDAFEAAPDLVLVSGDLGIQGRPEDYEEVERFIERLLTALERRAGHRPVLLAVPGNHDVLRPRDPLDRWPFEVLRRHDQDDPFARSLREHLWERRDAHLLEPLFAGYEPWARTRVREVLEVDAVGMEPGRVYVRSVTTSHVPGDLAVVVEKDDFRLGIVGLNTAWTSLDDDATDEGVSLPFEQFRSVLGGADGSVERVHQWVLLTHHGPHELTPASSSALDRIHARVELAAHLHGPGHREGRESSASNSKPMALPGLPLFAWGLVPRGPSSGYRLGRIGRDGRVESRGRVLAPIAARGSWRYVDQSEPVEQEAHRAGALPEWGPAELERYLARVQSLYSTIPLAGFGIRVRVPIELDELYVPLDVVLDLRATGQTFGSALEAEDALRHELVGAGHQVRFSEAFDAAAQFGGRRGLVLLGDPGSGKTTQLQRLLLAVAQGDPHAMGLPTNIVPVFLPLRRWADPAVGFEGLVESELTAPPLRMTQSFVDDLVHGPGPVLYLLDGLDEVSDEWTRAQLARCIDQAIRVHPRAYFVVTCRYAGYGGKVVLSEKFLELHLRPMTIEQSEQFVRKWFWIVETSLAADQQQARRRAQAEADVLVETLRRPDFHTARVATLTRNPLLLTTLCLVHRDRGRLPERRVELYDECVRVLLERWREAKHLPVSMLAAEAQRVLQPVARWLHEHEQRQATAEELTPALEAALAREGGELRTPGEFLRLIRDQSGLLTGWGGEIYGFMHLGFQEYLAAKELRVRGFEQPEVFEQLAGCFGDPWWQEVILLMLALQEEPPIFERFMRAVVEQPQFEQWASSELMDLCLREGYRVTMAPFRALVEAGGEADDAQRVRRQLAALELIARAAPEELEALEPSLRDHPAPAVRQWWDAYEERTAR